MNILICSGIKSKNISNGIQKAFKSSGVQFTIVEYIDDIPDIFSRGYVFDRAIIVEPGWTHDDKETEEFKIRERIGAFANAMGERSSNESSYVFLCKTNEMAEVIDEEIMNIRYNSIVLVKEPVYYASFFYDLIRLELEDLSEYEYNPDNVVESVEPDNSLKFDLNDETNDNSGIGLKDIPTDNISRKDADKDNINMNFNETETEEDSSPVVNDSNNDKTNIQEGFKIDDANFDKLSLTDIDFGNDTLIKDEGNKSKDYTTEPFKESEDQGIKDLGLKDFDIADLDNKSTDNGDNSIKEPDFDNINFDNINMNDIGTEKSKGESAEERNTDNDKQLNNLDFGSNDFDKMSFDKTQESEQKPDEQKSETENIDFESLNFDTLKGNTDLIPDESDTKKIDFESLNFDKLEFDTPKESTDQTNSEQETTKVNFDNLKLNTHKKSVDSVSDNLDTSRFEYEDKGISTRQPNNTDVASQTERSFSRNDFSYSEEKEDEKSRTDTAQDDEAEDIEDAPKTSRNNKTNKQNIKRAEKSQNEEDKIKIKGALDAVATKCCSIVITGCGGCGTSTIALNLANTAWRLGYKILLVDFDTVYKVQSYISKDHYDSVDNDEAQIMSAINSDSGINAYVSIVKPGYHLLTMGMASDSIKPEKAIKKEKLGRFLAYTKMNYNFVIYDIPFESAVDHLKDVTFSADDIVITMDSSNWGINKTLLAMCNIDNDDVTESMFSRAQIIYNRFRGLKNINGCKVKNRSDIAKAMDSKMETLVGCNLGYSFRNLNVCGMIKEDNELEKYWFSENQYSDTDEGFRLFRDILINIVLHK